MQKKKIWEVSFILEDVTCTSWRNIRQIKYWIMAEFHANKFGDVSKVKNLKVKKVGK